MPINVNINGREIELPEPITILAYLEAKGLLGRRLAIAHNGNVVSKDDYGDVVIVEGDTMEIVRPVGGG